MSTFNEKAGTIFWGQTYERFDQIRPPLQAIENGTGQPLNFFMDNPTLRLDWERFCSDSLIGFQNVQVDALRALTPRPITTNSTSTWTNCIDHDRGFDTLDVAAAELVVGQHAGAGLHRVVDRDRGLRLRDVDLRQPRGAVEPHDTSGAFEGVRGARERLEAVTLLVCLPARQPFFQGERVCLQFRAEQIE